MLVLNCYFIALTMGDNTLGERGRDSRRKKFFPNNKVNPESANITYETFNALPNRILMTSTEILSLVRLTNITNINTYMFMAGLVYC